MTITPPEKRTAQRGPHAKRVTEMRQRIFQAAIEALHDVGYAASTTLEIQRRAGISRGALLHHFPTKLDVILETARHIVAEQTRYYDLAFKKISDPKQLFLEVTRVAWDLMRMPSGMALLEIMIAARSDPALKQAFPAVAREIEDHQYRANLRLARASGITDEILVKRLNNLGLAALRGLSIQLLYSQDKEEINETFELYMLMKARWMDYAKANQRD